MNKAQLEQFLLKARTKTYAAGVGKVKAALDGSVQFEHGDGEWFYRDVYYIGNGIFPGLETIYYQDKPVWSMSYFGDFSKMTEEQADSMLRKALMDLWETTRIYKSVRKDYGDFIYTCEGRGTIDEVQGSEKIIASGKEVYFFFYAGGFIG